MCDYQVILGNVLCNKSIRKTNNNFGAKAREWHCLVRIFVSCNLIFFFFKLAFFFLNQFNHFAARSVMWTIWHIFGAVWIGCEGALFGFRCVFSGWWVSASVPPPTLTPSDPLQLQNQRPPTKKIGSRPNLGKCGEISGAKEGGGGGGGVVCQGAIREVCAIVWKGRRIKSLVHPV